MPASYLLDEATARRAIATVMPAIEQAMESGLVKRQQLHIVVLDPARPPHRCNFDFEAAILCEVSIHAENWQRPYDIIARAKAKASWEWMLPTQLLQQRMPYLLSAGDTRHYGSAVLDGIVVATSGVEAWFDQAFSEMIAAMCRALAIAKMQTEVLPAPRDTMGPDAGDA